MDATAPFRPLMLRATGISKRFDALLALDGFDLDVPRHGLISVIGPNGAGKSVFFDIVTGITPPAGGTIWFNGRDITGLPPNQVAAVGIARTFQTSRLFDNMTVLENVLVGEHTHLHASFWEAVFRTPAMIQEEAAAYTRAQELLRFTGLTAAAGQLAKNLPYGDQRRLEVARAMATQPQLLLLDEPTAGMNPHETATMMTFIARLRQEWGVTILLIEHDMRIVMRISDRVTVLDHGVKIAEGSPDEIRADPRVVEAYLGRPLWLATPQSAAP
ncbi:MAG TPA: ABC transporter ATP-binding protein [Chloroflexia bacterium]|nr:ABC transporter ATP-binding protein [Chloroflexia bacterium]